MPLDFQNLSNIFLGEIWKLIGLVASGWLLKNSLKRQGFSGILWTDTVETFKSSRGMTFNFEDLSHW